MLNQRDVKPAELTGCQRFLTAPCHFPGSSSEPSSRVSLQEKEGAAEKQQRRQWRWEGGKREMGEWEGNCAASSFLQALEAPRSSSGQGLQRTPSGPFFASQEILQSCLVQTKVSSFPLAALVGREQFDSSACFSSWHRRSRWEDILAQLEESVLSLGVLLFLFLKKNPTVNASNTKLGCS